MITSQNIIIIRQSPNMVYNQEIEDDRIIVLERRELEGGPDGIGLEGYTQLLALYLINSKITLCKFLWKKIPLLMKTNPQIMELWNLTQKIWLREIPAFYVAVNAFQWSPTLTPLVAELVDKIRDQELQLISIAYASIGSDEVGKLLGFDGQQVQNAVIQHGWTLSKEDGMIERIKPIERHMVHSQVSLSENQMANLTDYVSFLEN